MSIKSLFENIADAIKEKNPNIANVTPVEMPSAIRSIPSGSSTAGGVTYDNTASGLTANNVQDAIDELAEDVSTINSDLSELTKHSLNNYEDITSHQAPSSAYICPSDGYVLAHLTGNGEIAVRIDNMPLLRISTAWDRASLYVRKDTTIYVELLNNGVLYFYPLE